MSLYDSEDIPKYKKKSKKGGTKKSNHKHEFEDVLLIREFGGRSSHVMGKRCIHCGLIRDKNWFISERTSEGLYRMLSDEEILEKYKDLPCIDLRP